MLIIIFGLLSMPSTCYLKLKCIHDKSYHWSTGPFVCLVSFLFRAQRRWHYFLNICSKVKCVYTYASLPSRTSYIQKNRGLKRGTNYHNNSVNNAKKFYYKTFHYQLLLVTQTSFFFLFIVDRNSRFWLDERSTVNEIVQSIEIE